jgi:hypothetical protein
MDLKINLLNENPSDSFLKCIAFISENPNKLKDHVMDVCCKLDKKNIFCWNNLFEGVNYLENIRRKNKFIWYVMLYKIAKKYSNDNRITIIMPPEEENHFNKAAEYCLKEKTQI